MSHSLTLPIVVVVVYALMYDEAVHAGLAILNTTLAVEQWFQYEILICTFMMILMMILQS